MPRSGDGEQGLWYHFTLEHSTWNGDGSPAATNGRYFGVEAVQTQPAWYGTGGWRLDSRGTMTDVSIISLIWSSTASGQTAYDLYCDSNSITYANAHASRSDGIPVRCVRE